MWSASVDLSHHYALAFRLSENWSLGVANDPSLGEMNLYPRASHALAAIIGLVFGSTFLGIQFVSLAALALTWGAVIFILNSFPLRVACVSSVGFACVLALNRDYMKFNVHGAELIDNFFFSQLVAQSMAFFVLAVAIVMEVKGRSEYLIALFFIAAIFAVTGVHLLPALEIFGVFVGGVILNNYVSRKESTYWGVKKHLWVLGCVAIAAVSVFFNPAFAAMRKISENNGSLVLAHISGAVGLIFLCVLALVVAGFQIFLWIRKYDEKTSYVGLKYLGLYGASVALLCLAQMVVLGFGFGSEYAAKKYAFGIVTYVLISVPVFAGLVLEKKFANFPSNRFIGWPLFRVAIPVGAYMTAFIFSMPQAKTLDTSDIVLLERQLIALRDMAPAVSREKSNVVFDLANMPPTIDYMFSIAIAKTPVAIAIPDVLVSRKLNDIGRYGAILTAVGSKPYYRSVCKFPVSMGSIALVDAACVGGELAESAICTGEFDLSKNGGVDGALVSGFSAPEDHGRWTDGLNATFNCAIRGKGPTKAIIYVTPFIHGSHDKQRLRVTIDSLVREYVLDSTMIGRSIEVPLPSRRTGEKLAIDFHMPDAISPAKLGLSEDGRVLGVSIKKIAFE